MSCRFLLGTVAVIASVVGGLTVPIREMITIHGLERVTVKVSQSRAAADLTESDFQDLAEGYLCEHCGSNSPTWPLTRGWKTFNRKQQETIFQLLSEAQVESAEFSSFRDKYFKPSVFSPDNETLFFKNEAAATDLNLAIAKALKPLYSRFQESGGGDFDEFLEFVEEH